MDEKRFGPRKTGGWKPARKTAPEVTTHEEVKYIKYLIENQIPVCIKLEDNQEVTGVIEYYDQSFIRITRVGEPNVFVYKDQIKYLYELP